MKPADLPIFEIQSKLLAQLEAQRRIIVQAPTGSGKSTQVPQMLLDHGILGNGQVDSPEREVSKGENAEIIRKFIEGGHPDLDEVP